MKKIALFLIILLIIAFIVGCNNTEKSAPVSQQADSVTSEREPETESTEIENTDAEKEQADFEKYKGDWKLKVEGNEDLYRITSLEEYFGSTGISITEINNGEVKGRIYSIQGAPSYRQAEVSFSGKIEDGKLKAVYEDEAWEYSGNIELTFGEDMIAAKITRNEMKIVSLWGIPEGEFTFLKPIETEKVNISDQEKETLEQFLFPTAKDAIKPFAEGDLTDEMVINFVGYNLALGFLDISEFGNKVEGNAEIVFDESVMNDLAVKYFGVEVKEHKTYEIVTYEKGKYTVPALGGVTEHPQVRLLIKDKENDGVYYAIVDYVFEYPEEGEKLEYQHLIKLQEDNNYTIKAIIENESPLNF
ncbi:MAG: hypothetical protein APF84_15675 [Gracilibacter sp. BRH_c7a]|nr:MAG: hypothetical protein APF84_15675 [Gracilibacter sp. BRH_c7a]